MQFQQIHQTNGLFRYTKYFTALQPRHNRMLACAQSFSWQDYSERPHSGGITNLGISCFIDFFFFQHPHLIEILYFAFYLITAPQPEGLSKVSSLPSSISGCNWKQSPRYVGMNLNVTQQTGLTVALIRSYSFNLTNPIPLGESIFNGLYRMNLTSNCTCPRHVSVKFYRWHLFTQSSYIQ